MASQKDLQPFYKNWFFWILVSVAVAYFLTRNNDRPAPAVDYMTALKEKALAKLDSGIVDDKMFNEKTSEDEKEELFLRIPLDRLKPGTILHFGSNDDTNNRISVTLLSEQSAEVTVQHGVNAKGDSSSTQQMTETGTYAVAIFEGSQILTDNIDHPLMQKPAIILENLSYGADKSHPLLRKKYCIAKSKHVSGSESPVLRIFPWFDPANYPKKSQEFSFEENQILFGLSMKR